jgi:hypothetical protein
MLMMTGSRWFMTCRHQKGSVHISVHARMNTRDLFVLLFDNQLINFLFVALFF